MSRYENYDPDGKVDVVGLVKAGLLDLAKVFDMADWRRVDGITAYAAGKNGDETEVVWVVLEEATEYGITAYRWSETNDGGPYNHGPVTLDLDEAVKGGEEWAEQHHNGPDTNDLIRQIVETGYFGDASFYDICAICEEATRHSQGYLLLPAGKFCGHPIDQTWSDSCYLQCDKYVTLDATYPGGTKGIRQAAADLLRAVTNDE